MKAPFLKYFPLALYVASCSANAQIGTITGRITQERSGAPFEGVLAAVDAPEHYGRHASNDEGVYLLRNVQAGSWSVEFHCPSASYVGREIETVSVVVQPDETTVVDLEVPENYCYEPPYSELRSDFRGHLAFGFEYSSFLPCDAGPLNLSTNTFFDRNNIWVDKWPADTLLQWDTLYYLEFEGTLKGPGNFGHLGVSEYELEIEAVELVREVDIPVSEPTERLLYIERVLYLGDIECSRDQEDQDPDN